MLSVRVVFFCACVQLVLAPMAISLIQCIRVLLLFNPQEPHCISTNSDECDDDGVMTTSHYFKRNMVGLNDNNLEFEES